MSAMDDRNAFGLLLQGHEYELLATADRTRFVLRSRPDFYAADLQGEDARRFRADYDSVSSHYPAWQPDQTLAQLWDQGGYGWFAAQDGE